MKLIYKPFGIVGILAGLLSKKIFEFIWAVRQGGAAQGDHRDTAVAEGARRGRGAGRDVQGHARGRRPRRAQGASRT